MTTCYVVDDEAHNITLLSNYIQRTPGLELVGTAEDPLVALHAITSEEVAPDIVFADVDMPQLTGVDLAGMINTHTEVVFATAYPDYALQAFEKNAIDYLVKPISYERFLQSVSKVRARISAKGKTAHEKEAAYIFVKSEVKGKIIRVDFNEIDFVEALQNYVRIHTGNGPVTTYLTMKEIGESLPENKFLRVHKSFIVNSDKIRAVEGNQIILDTKQTIALGASYRAVFLKAINGKLVTSKRMP